MTKRAKSDVSKTTFRRMTIDERGHLPNKLRLWPVRLAAVSEDALTLHTARETVHVPWPSLAATIEEQPAYKMYGKAAGVHYVRRTLILATPKRTFRIDVSKKFPDLESTPQFLQELAKHATIHIVKKRGTWWQL